MMDADPNTQAITNILVVVSPLTPKKTLKAPISIENKAP
jgi:hypothetical protein